MNAPRRRRPEDDYPDPNDADFRQKRVNAQLPDARDAVSMGYDPGSIVRGGDGKIQSARNAAGQVTNFRNGVSPERVTLDQQMGRSTAPVYPSAAAATLDKPTAASVALNRAGAPAVAPQVLNAQANTTTDNTAPRQPAQGTDAPTGTPPSTPSTATPANATPTPSAGRYPGLPAMPHNVALDQMNIERAYGTSPALPALPPPVPARNAGGYITDAGAIDAANRAGTLVSRARQPYGKIGQTSAGPAVAENPQLLGTTAGENGSFVTRGQTDWAGTNAPADGGTGLVENGLPVVRGADGTLAAVAGPPTAVPSASNVASTAGLPSLPPPTPAAKPASLDNDIQKAAVAAYPEIGNAGSYANTAFLNRMKPGANTQADADAALKDITAPTSTPATPAPVIAQTPTLKLPDLPAPTTRPNNNLETFPAGTAAAQTPDAPKFGLNTGAPAAPQGSNSFSGSGTTGFQTAPLTSSVAGANIAATTYKNPQSGDIATPSPSPDSDQTAAIVRNNELGTTPAKPTGSYWNPPGTPANADDVIARNNNIGASPVPKPNLVAPDSNTPTAPSSAADTLSKAPGYGADPGTYGATPASTAPRTTYGQDGGFSITSKGFDPSATVASTTPDAGRYPGLPTGGDPDNAGKDFSGVGGAGGAAAAHSPALAMAMNPAGTAGAGATPPPAPVDPDDEEQRRKAAGSRYPGLPMAA